MASPSRHLPEAPSLYSYHSFVRSHTLAAHMILRSAASDTSRHVPFSFTNIRSRCTTSIVHGSSPHSHQFLYFFLFSVPLTGFEAERHCNSSTSGTVTAIHHLRVAHVHSHSFTYLSFPSQVSWVQLYPSTSQANSVDLASAPLTPPPRGF